MEQLKRFSGISVSINNKKTDMNTVAGIFRITPDYAKSSADADMLAITFLHEIGHIGQSTPDDGFSQKFVNYEKKASRFAVDVAKRIPLHQDAIDWMEEDARTGHYIDQSIPDPMRNKKKP